MRIITAGRDKGWCRCEKCDCLLVPERYEAHVGECNGIEPEWKLNVSPFGTIPWARYRDLVAELPLPTTQQKRNFIDHVSNARSWYKAVSPYPPGIRIHFFLYWYAGCDRQYGKAVVTERQTGLRTSDYREAFGYLAYLPGPMNKALFAVPEAGNSSRNVLEYGLPQEVFEAGTSHLTGAVHTLSAANAWVWTRQREPIEWPDESGGRATLEQILHRCHELGLPGFARDFQPSTRPFPRYKCSAYYEELADPLLFQLLAPERARQQAEMLRAIDRMCDLITSRRSASAQPKV